MGLRAFGDEDVFDSGLSMVKVNEVSPAIQEQVDTEIKRLLQVLSSRLFDSFLLVHECE